MTQERAAHSGAAASSAALAQAIRGMSLLLCATLADSSTPPGSAAAQGRRRDPAPAASSAEALCALEALAVSSMASAEEEAAAAEPALPAAASLSVSGQVRLNVPSVAGEQGAAEEPACLLLLPRLCQARWAQCAYTHTCQGLCCMLRRLTLPPHAAIVLNMWCGFQEKYLVRRDTAWVDSTLQRLVPLLQRVLPPLCSHPQHSVREALAKGEKTLVWLHNQIGSICGCSVILISWSKAFPLTLCLAL